MEEIILRHENKNEYHLIEEMIRDIFWDIYKPGACEHLVVHNLRNDNSYIPELSYIALINNEIVGAIYYSFATINDKKVLYLGPIGVKKEYQNKHIGAKLINFTSDLAKNKGYDLIFLTGNPDYYHRFGFTTATKLGFTLPYIDKGEEAPFFMVKILNDNDISTYKGEVLEPSVFNVNEEELIEFDKQFKKKTKHKLDTQIFN